MNETSDAHDADVFDIGSSSQGLVYVLAIRTDLSTFLHAAMADFEPKLLRLLDDKDIHADVRAFLATLPVRSIDDLATLVEGQTEIQAAILDHVTSMKTNVQQRFRMKQAWRFAHDEYDRKSTRRQQGWAENAMDEALEPDDTKERYTTFALLYKLHLRPWDKGSDLLLGRVTRESEKWTMTFMPLEKIRDLKNTQVLAAAKRQKLTDDMEIWTKPREDAALHITTPMPYLHGIRVYCTTLAVGGNRKVLSKLPREPPSTLEINYAPFSDLWDYASHAEEKTHTFMFRHPQASGVTVTQWLRVADEATRTRVMELVRTEPQHTVGEAFKAALHECAHEWAIPKAVTTVADRPQQHERHDEERGNSGRKKTPPRRDRAVPEPPSAAKTKQTPYVSHDKREACHKWNDHRGCTKPCPDNRGHWCSVCKASGHTAKEHKAHPEWDTKEQRTRR